MSEPADICLILEGTYPYVSGGVSSWTHELIKMQDHLRFALVSLVSPNAPTEMLYELPSNVVSMQTLRLQDLPHGEVLSSKDEEDICAKLEPLLLSMQSFATLADLQKINETLEPWRGRIGAHTLMQSEGMWKLLLRMYNATMPTTSFLDYFWSWRGLFGGLFSIMLAPLPKAHVYHSLCTGYAGLLLARAHLETGKACLLTEHGIYTNERRIEIASADWIDDPHGFNLAVSSENEERDLKDLWIDTFGNYSRFCYQAASEIITLYEGNQEFQLMDGASPEKMRVVPNGIDFDYFSAVKRTQHVPTIALIGRIVPIKDIKVFIKAVGILKQSVPNLRAFVIGPDDEDPAYVKECRALAEHLQLGKTLEFTGKADIRKYLGEIDIMALTSISEAQPLVVLEAGAAGIPTVSTNVGACQEMIMGSSHEKPQLGAGGAVVGTGNPHAFAQAMLDLMRDNDKYKKCSAAIKERVGIYYRKADQRQAYAETYRRLIQGAEANTNVIVLQDREKAKPAVEPENSAA